MEPAPEWRIRPATIGDAAVLASLRAEFLAEVTQGTPLDPALRPALDEYFARSLKTGEFIAILAVAGDTIIATSGLVWHQHPPTPKNVTGREGYIMNMYTLPAWRGRGIAAALLERLLDIIREHGCRWAVLHAMAKARGLYARFGFQACESEMRLDLQAS
ncbi:MAG: GNAT family N-acetyltransferase [Phycisphaerales bacterium]|nr:GNAT family N-acetyltransferase [Phycisphaerales bacterium]